MIKNIEFQNKCVNELITLTATTKKGIILKSPTGSGKTIILLKYIESYFNNYDCNSVFVWFCPGAGELEEQSMTEFKKHFKDKVAKNLSDVLSTGFNAKDTVFINWEQVNSSKNKAITESEHKNLIDQVIKAHRSNINFIVIVDEEHTYNTPKSQAVIDIFNSKCIFRVSATAKKSNSYEWYEISEKDVIAEGLITKAIFINEGMQAGNITNENELLLSLADNKRKEIQAAYKAKELDINPLVLIQFPDKSTKLIESVEKILKNMGYDYDNKAVAKWMSEKEDKINLEGIKEKNSEQLFLLMKQAVATGWNCTRAKILVKLRENMSEDFQIQTIGRIRRMPESKHYDVEVLDNCYLYTFDEKYKESVKKELFSAYDARRLTLKDCCKDFSLIKEYCDEDSSCINPLTTYNKINDFLIQKYGLNGDTSKNKTILEANGYNLSDSIVNKTIQGKVVETEAAADITSFINMNRDVKTHDDGLDLRQTTDMLKGIIHADYKSTESILRKLFFSTANGGKLIKLSNKEYYAFIINNRNILRQDLCEATASICADPISVLSVKKATFKIPLEEISLYDSEKKGVKDLFSNAYNGYRTDCWVCRSLSERLFEKYCDANNNVEWLYKNGDKGQQYFSIVYSDGLGHQQLFYPDYIVKLKDGNIWIVEAKGGEAEDGESENIDKFAEKKFNALNAYAKANNVNFAFVRNKKEDDEFKLYGDNSVYTEEMKDNWVSIDHIF